LYTQEFRYIIRLDFYDSSIVSITQAKSGESPTLVVFSPSKNEVPKTKETLTILSTVICKWNKDKNYDLVLSNCQHFVEDILRSLDIDPKYMWQSNALGRYLDHIRYKPENKVRRLIRNDGKTEIIFNTHEELDKFQRLCDIAKIGDENYLSSDEKELLKAFHRGFQCEEARDENCTISELSALPSTCPLGPITYQ